MPKIGQKKKKIKKIKKIKIKKTFFETVEQKECNDKW